MSRYRAWALGASGTLGMLLLGGCIPAIPRVDAGEAGGVVEAMESSPTVDELALGREVYLLRCSGCHFLRGPHLFPLEEWADLMEAMRREQEVELSQAEQAQILGYIEFAQIWRRQEQRRREERRSQRMR